MIRSTMIAAFLMLAALPARASDMDDLGVLMGLRLYSVGLMDYCFDHVEARPAFKETGETWKTRNAEAMAVTDAAFARLRPTAEDVAGLLQFVSNTITSDFAAAAADPLAFCEALSSGLARGENDATVKAAEALGRLKASAPGP
jgi:hypothetical protein